MRTRKAEANVELRDSRIPWLLEIPAHWDEIRLRFLVDSIEQGWSPQADTREPDEGEWGVLKLGAVSRGHFDPSEAKAMPPELEPRTDYEVRPGDFLLTRANTPSLVGDVCYVERTRPQLMLSDLIYRLGLRQDLIDGRYLAFFFGLPLGRTQIESDARGTSGSMVKISQEHIKNWWAPVPPLKEQVRIADFLDAETAWIDALIAAKNNHLTILAEKRSAVITQAVTRGLDPNVELGDSGIPWLGKLPAHWAVTRLKFLLHGIEQGWSPECDNTPAAEEEWGVLKAGCCNGGQFNAIDNKTLPADLEPPANLEIQAGDVLMSRASGSTELIGSVARVPLGLRRKLIFSDKLYRLRLNDIRADRDYVVSTLGSTIGRRQVVAAISGAAGLANNISQASVLEFVLPCPPVAEQRSIASWILAATKRLERIASATTHSLTLLRERREAVIAAAVTGQLDVKLA